MFSNKALVPFFIIMAVWAAVVLYRAGIAPWRRLTWLALLSLLILSYAGVSALWAVDGWASILSLLRMAALFAMGLLLMALADARPTLPSPGFDRALWIGITVACAIILVETLSGGLIVPILRSKGPELPEYLFNQAITIVSILGWFAVLFMRARAGVWPAVLLGAVMLAAVGVSGNTSARVALAIGVASLPLFLLGGRPARRIGMVVIAGAMLAMPVLVSQMANRPMIADKISRVGGSAKHRLVIWDYVTDKVVERPLFGWGYEASRRLEPPGDLATRVKFSRLPLHPHNAPMQIWLELGLVGALFLTFFVARLFIAVERCPVKEAEKAVLSAMLVTTCVVASLTYGIWQNWWIASLWIIAALIHAAMPGLVRIHPENSA